MRLLNLLFPPKCAFCGEPLRLNADPSSPCVKCLKDLTVLHEPLFGAVPGVMCLAPLKYGGSVRAGVHGLKFRRRTAGVRYFARLMACCLERYDLKDFGAVTWVPVSAARLRTRSYDQSELLAREVARIISVKPRRLLFKPRSTKQNSTLKTEDERMENVRGAFALMPFARVPESVLLIDDVITTGSTAAECAALLREHGAGRIVVLALAQSGSLHRV